MSHIHIADAQQWINTTYPSHTAQWKIIESPQRQAAGPCQREEWKLLYFIFKKVNSTAITMSHLYCLCQTKWEHPKTDKLSENTCQNQSGQQAGVLLNSDFISLQSKQGSYVGCNFVSLTESHLCLSLGWWKTQQKLAGHSSLLSQWVVLATGWLMVLLKCFRCLSNDKL